MNTHETSGDGTPTKGEGPPPDASRDGKESARSVDEIDRLSAQLREEARGAAGIAGVDEAPSLRQTFREHGVGWYPLIALGCLVVVDEFQSYAFLVLGPEIGFSLGVSAPVLGMLVALKMLALTAAALPMAAFVQRRPRRAALAITTAFAWSAFTGGTAFVISVWGLFAILLADGASSGSVRAVHEPLLLDSYPPETRVRVLGFYRAANAFGNVLAALTVAALTTWFGLTWRGVLLGMGVLSLLAAFISVGLRDPGFGRFDTKRIRSTVRSAINTSSHDSDPGTPRQGLRFGDVVRRVLLIPTIRRALVASAVLGMMIVPLLTFLFFFLEERWAMGPAARGLFFTLAFLPSVPIVMLLGFRAEAWFRRDPRLVVNLTAALMFIGATMFAIGALTPTFGVMAVAFALGFAAFASLQPGLSAIMLTIVPAEMRPHTAALQGVFLAGVGGFGGAIALGGLEQQLGTGGAIATLTLPAAVAALTLLSARRTVNNDLDRMIDELIEQEQLEILRENNAKLPLLACRRVNFSYGPMQVLFDVDFTVDDGEMVALLGTNGAGKSTLLRVISGVGVPTSGSVRLDGADITYLGPDRRINLGIATVPGGQAVFGPMSVAENLRLYGYTLGRDRRTLDSRIEDAFSFFPVLAERRNQPASTLSGGEQQMLALTKTFILEPRLLLIDELTLGLAPKVVSSLFEMVRHINETGTAIVLVEQSVNLALSLVEHAYFMEKGQIRFDGPADQLLERTDLLRSVFLEGAAEALQ